MEQAGWTYDGQTATTIIRIARLDVRRQTVITVREDRQTPAALAHGLKGLMARLARVNYYNTLATACHILDPQERLGVETAQAGNRISRWPATLAAERRHLRRMLGQLPAMLRRWSATYVWYRAGPPARYGLSTSDSDFERDGRR